MCSDHGLTATITADELSMKREGVGDLLEDLRMRKI